MEDTFFCNTCQTYKPIRLLHSTLGKNHNYICTACNEKIQKYKKRKYKNTPTYKRSTDTYDPTALYITIKELAKQVNVSNTTVRTDIIDRGVIPFIRNYSNKSLVCIHPKYVPEYIEYRKNKHEN